MTPDTCNGCGLILRSSPMMVDGLAGKFCSTACIETALIGGDHCRRCGAEMGNAYTSVDSRLCSEDCSANYYAFVRGDRSAAFGTGKRLRAWMETRAARGKSSVLLGRKHQTLAERDEARRQSGAARQSRLRQRKTASVIQQNQQDRGVTFHLPTDSPISAARSL